MNLQKRKAGWVNKLKLILDEKIKERKKEGWY